MGIFGWSYPPGCSGPPEYDGPEVCPICGADNWDEDRDMPIYDPQPECCSEACADRYVEQLEAEAQSEADYMRELGEPRDWEMP